MKYDVNDCYSNLETINIDLKFLTKSEIRLRILNCLEKTPYTFKCFKTIERA